MADAVKGKLVWTENKKVRRVIFPTKKGTSLPTPFDAQQLAPALRSATEDEVEVELELEGGKPVRIRPIGQPWQVTPSARPPIQQPQPRSQPYQQPQPARPALNKPPSEFVNPYNFLPTVPRDSIPDNSELRDRPPVGHDRLHDGHFTGVIRVTLTTETPLLIPDAAKANENNDGHKTFPVRFDADGKPYLAPTTVKGMLRSAYEAITNSRMGVFAGHEARLGLRQPAREGLRLIPARVENTASGPRVVLYPGDSQIEPDRGPDGPMYAAWLPSYGAVTQNWGPLAQHGQEVWAFVTLWNHQRFSFWNVVELRPTSSTRPPHTPTDTRRPGRRSSPVANHSGQWVRGFVCITNRNIDSKHDERVFFSTRPANPPHPTNPTLPLPDELRAEWRALIRDYQTTHEEEIRQGQAGPPALTNSVWSRHVTGGNAECELSPGTLCFAQVEPDLGAGGLRVRSLFPVMISRGIYRSSPQESVSEPHQLRPATEYAKLSPADRVFGWVYQKGSGAHRGQLRIGPVRCTAEGNPVRAFPAPGLPLAILGQPKPQQVRFYLGDVDGRAQQPGQTKEQAGYDGTKRLRGRKVYPRHANLPTDHWNPSTDGSPVTSHPYVFREYLRHPNSEKIRDNQNRSILGWVEPGTAFSFDLHVTNLSQVELGALVWLLALPEGHYHRLGLGKPLGFGSVRLTIDRANTRVLEAGGWKTVYRTLDELIPATAVADLDGATSVFTAELTRAYPQDGLRILQAFATSAQGVPGLPVQYPRVRDAGTTGAVPPNPNGEGFEWFTANDAGQQLPLPELTDSDPGLPILERRQGRR